MRDELIEAMARAMFEQLWPEHRWDHVSMRRYNGTSDTRDTFLGMAVAALDAALAKLEEPSEDMVEAGQKSSCDSINGRPVWKLTTDVQAAHNFIAMLQPLKVA